MSSQKQHGTGVKQSGGDKVSSQPEPHMWLWVPARPTRTTGTRLVDGMRAARILTYVQSTLIPGHAHGGSDTQAPPRLWGSPGAHRLHLAVLRWQWSPSRAKRDQGVCTRREWAGASGGPHLRGCG